MQLLPYFHRVAALTAADNSRSDADRKTDTDRALEYYLFNPLRSITSAKSTAHSTGASNHLRQSLPQIANAVLLADRQRRSSLERNITALLPSEWRLVQYLDVDMSDETPMKVARRDTSHSSKTALFS